jgi:hypothetical protein
MFTAFCYDRSNNGRVNWEIGKSYLRGLGFREWLDFAGVEECQYYGIIIFDYGVDKLYGHNPERATSYVHQGSCEGWEFVANWGAAQTTSYNYEVTNGTIANEAKEVFKRLNGKEGRPKRKLSAAIEGQTILLSGDGNFVLAPTVTYVTPLPGDWDVVDPVAVVVTFDCDMEQSAPEDLVFSENGIIIKNEDLEGWGPFWSLDGRLCFLGLPFTCPNPWSFHVLGSAVKSAVGGHLIDGGNWGNHGEGPNGDDFVAGYFFTVDDSDCNNWATSLAGAGAFEEDGQVTVFWSVEFQEGTTAYDVLGPFGDVLTSVPAKMVPEETPASYAVQFVTDERIFRIIEHDAAGSTTTSRPFRLGEKPENFDTLINTVPEDIDGHVIFQYDDLTPFYAGGRSGSTPDVIVVSSRSDFISACAPAIGYLEELGRSVETVLTTKDPNDIRNSLAPYYFGWDGLGLTPRVILVGEAYENVNDARNILGKFYFPDSTGMCYFTSTCSSDDYIVDFDGDGIADFEVGRIDASNVVEVEHTVQTYLLSDATIDSRPQTAAFMDGDLDDNCDLVDEPRATLDEIEATFQEHGFSTTMVHDSQFPDCYDLYSRRDAGVNLINSGAVIVKGLGWVTNRSQGPALLIQKDYPPYWNMSWLNPGNTFIALFEGCDLGDGDRLNPYWYPPLVKMFTTADPDVTTPAAFWISNGRGAWGRQHLLLAKEFTTWQFSPWVVDLYDVAFKTKRSLAERHPGLKPYLATVHVYGWPVRLRGFSTSVEEDKQLPSRIRMSPPYPNPARDLCIIKFGVPADGRVTIEVFDVNGRRVDTVFDREMSAGWHGRVWEPRVEVTSGVYYCKITAGGSSQTRTINLIR